MAGCFFIGHRDTPDTVLPTLAAEVERHIMEYGVVDFVVGHYGRFDALAAKAVMDAKKRHPAVTLTLLLPYHPAERAVDTHLVLTGPSTRRAWRRRRSAWPSSGPITTWWNTAPT